MLIACCSLFLGVECRNSGCYVCDSLTCQPHRQTAPRLSLLDHVYQRPHSQDFIRTQCCWASLHLKSFGMGLMSLSAFLLLDSVYLPKLAEHSDLTFVIARYWDPRSNIYHPLIYSHSRYFLSQRRQGLHLQYQCTCPFYLGVSSLCKKNPQNLLFFWDNSLSKIQRKSRESSVGRMSEKPLSTHFWYWI